MDTTHERDRDFMSLLLTAFIPVLNILFMGLFCALICLIFEIQAKKITRHLLFLTPEEQTLLSKRPTW